MTAVACVPRGGEDPQVRPKRLSLTLLKGGGGLPSQLPPELALRPGARELLSQMPAPARDLIIETCGKIPEFFGQGARFALKAAVDVDAVEVEHLLYIVIGAELSAPDASRAYDRFLEAWWIDNLDRGEGSVHIGLELL